MDDEEEEVEAMEELPKNPTHSPGRSPQQSPRHSPQHSPRSSPQHSPRGSWQQSPPHPPPPYSTLYVEPHPAHHGVYDEASESATQSQRVDDEAPRGFGNLQDSIIVNVISRTTDVITRTTNDLIDFLLPPLPPESSAAASEILEGPEGVSNAKPGPRALQRENRGHVAFEETSPDYGESQPSVSNFEASTISLDPGGPIEEFKRRSSKFRSRALSSRFFQLPLRPPPKEYTLRETLFFAYQTLGVVYGDLGTSPLYVYPTIKVKNPSEQDFLGILSLIFWTLTLIGVLKYSLIVLRADDHGEGGTFAVYSLLCQHAKIGQHHGEDSPAHDLAGKRLSHLCTLDESTQYSRTKAFLENSPTAQKVLLFVVMMGTCMLIGDGILTPAISVISAIEGIQTAVPTLNKAVVVVVSAIILVGLFVLQSHGTHRVSLYFCPVMAVWFLTTPLVGIYNIATFYPGIFKAFSPAHIVYFFRDKGKEAWLMLGGTVLCITGAEAMYADMGHFTKHSIQLAFCTVVYPSVLITYSGQTAYLIAHPQDHSEGFFKSIPKKVYWPMFIISTLAAVVASQGLISATFSIVKQSVALNYFPRIKMVHTSADKEGQIYSPEVNYILMVLCLAIVFGFRSSSTIGNAFGLAVVFVMLITTCLMVIVMLVIWRWRPVFIISFFSLFIFVETIYVSSVVTKVPQGGWLPFAVALVVTLIMFTWNMGCQAKFHYEMKNQITKTSFGKTLIQMGNVRVPGICFLYTDLMSGVPPIVQHYVSNVRSLHRVLVFTTVRFLPVKTVLPGERFLVGRAGFDGVYRCVARYGYTDVLKIENNEFLDQFLANLCEYIVSAEELTPREKFFISEEEASPHRPVDVEISVLKNAGKDGAVYVLGRGELKVSKDAKFMTRLIIGKFYKFLRANCRSEVSTMDIPYEQFLEIGMKYHI